MVAILIAALLTALVPQLPPLGSVVLLACLVFLECVLFSFADRRSKPMQGQGHALLVSSLDTPASDAVASMEADTALLNLA